MDVIMARKGIDAHKARSFVPVGQDQVANNLRALDLESGKGHPHLEGNPRLFGQNHDWATASDLGNEEFKKIADHGRFALEV